MNFLPYYRDPRRWIDLPKSTQVHRSVWKQTICFSQIWRFFSLLRVWSWVLSTEDDEYKLVLTLQCSVPQQLQLGLNLRSGRSRLSTGFHENNMKQSSAWCETLSVRRKKHVKNTCGEPCNCSNWSGPGSKETLVISTSQKYWTLINTAKGISTPYQ